MARLGNEAKRLNGLNVLNMRLASFHPAVSRRDQDEFLRQNHQAVKRHETDTLRGPSSSRSSIEITPLVLDRRPARIIGKLDLPQPLSRRSKQTLRGLP